MVVTVPTIAYKSDHYYAKVITIRCITMWASLRCVTTLYEVHYAVLVTTTLHYAVLHYAVFRFTVWIWVVWCVFGLSRGPTFVFASFPYYQYIIISVLTNCKEEVVLFCSSRVTS